MGREDEQTAKGSDQVPRVVEIAVNKKPVKITKGDRAGLEIKDAAIAQQVDIQRDFILSLEKGEKDETGKESKPRIIGDMDIVKVHENMRFRAVDDDDNS